METKYHLNKTLIEFVEESRLKNNVSLFEDEQKEIDTEELYKIYKYANALAHRNRLGYFIPCDENDVPLEKPTLFDPRSKTGNTQPEVFDEKLKQYQQACERVLFEGFRLNIFKESIYLEKDQTFIIDIERLKKMNCECFISYNLPLTKAGAKFFGYEKKT